MNLVIPCTSRESIVNCRRGHISYPQVNFGTVLLDKHVVVTSRDDIVVLDKLIEVTSRDGIGLLDKLFAVTFRDSNGLI